AINLELEFVHSLVRIINATIKVHVQNNPTLIVGVLINELLRVTVRLDLFTAPQFDQLGAILANRCPTTSSRQCALRVIVVFLPEVHCRNKPAITVGRVLNNTRQLLIERVLRHRRTTHVSPRRGVDELPQTGRGRRRVLRLRVPARLARDDVVESVPPSAALNRPTLSFSPFLTTPAPGPGSDNILNVGENVTNEVGDLRNVVSNPLDRHVDHILSAGPDKLTEASRTDTPCDFVLNLLERPSKPIKTETAACAVTRRATGTNLRTTRRIKVGVVIVSRCPPDATNLREFLTARGNPFIEERLLRRILTTRTIVSIAISPRIVQ